MAAAQDSMGEEAARMLSDLQSEVNNLKVGHPIVRKKHFLCTYMIARISFVLMEDCESAEIV